MKLNTPSAVLLALLLFLMGALGAPGSAAALTLVEIIHGGTNDDPQNLTDNYAAITDVNNITLVDSSGSGGFGSCNFSQDTSCNIDLTGLDASFLTVKADGFEALYSVAPGDTNVIVDVSTWDDDLGIPGASAFAAEWPNQGGNYPGISNIRAWDGGGGSVVPVPEPSAALVFTVGSLVTGVTVRRQRPGGPKRA